MESDPRLPLRVHSRVGAQGTPSATATRVETTSDQSSPCSIPWAGMTVSLCSQWTLVPGSSSQRFFVEPTCSTPRTGQCETSSRSQRAITAAILAGTGGPVGRPAPRFGISSTGANAFQREECVHADRRRAPIAGCVSMSRSIDSALILIVLPPEPYGVELAGGDVAADGLDRDREDLGGLGQRDEATGGVTVARIGCSWSVATRLAAFIGLRQRSEYGEHRVGVIGRCSLRPVVQIDQVGHDRQRPVSCRPAPPRRPRGAHPRPLQVLEAKAISNGHGMLPRDNAATDSSRDLPA